MKKKIFLFYIILAFIGIILAGLLISNVIQNFYEQKVYVELTNLISLMEHEINTGMANDIDIDYNKFAGEYKEIFAKNALGKSSANQFIRITFIDFDGNVLGESETDYSSMENHIDREEVAGALEEEFSKSIRHSDTLKTDFMYVASAIKDKDLIIRLAVPLNEIQRINNMILLITLIAAISALLLTSLIALKFSASVTRPVNELISASKEISEGKYSRRVYIDSKDELGILANTFNVMATKLENSLIDLIEKNYRVDSIINSLPGAIIAVDKDLKIVFVNSIAKQLFNIENNVDVIEVNIIEIVRNSQINFFLGETIKNNTPLVNEISISTPEQKIMNVYTNPIMSNEENENSGGIIYLQDITNLKKLEQIRTEFVSNVTHELKTPLTSIKGYIETLKNGAINDKKVATNFLEIIDIESERLNNLITDILELSEIENAQKDIDKKNHPLQPIVEDVFSIVQGVAKKKDVSLDIEIEDDLVIFANPKRMKQMLTNLVNNAIKYNKSNGSVLVKAFRHEGKVVVIVKDNGIGISEEHIPRIFERFYRVDQGRSRSIGGTGLGLSIVKHIVNLYNGNIKVLSEPEKGSEFIIQLPSD